MSQLCLKAQRKTDEAWEEKDFANQMVVVGPGFERRDGSVSVSLRTGRGETEKQFQPGPGST